MAKLNKAKKQIFLLGLILLLDTFFLSNIIESHAFIRSISGMVLGITGFTLLGLLYNQIVSIKAFEHNPPEGEKKRASESSQWANSPNSPNGESGLSLSNVPLSKFENYRACIAWRVLAVCNKIIYSGYSKESVMSDVCRKIVSVGGYRMALAAYYNEDESVKIQPVSVSGVADEFLTLPEFALWCERSLLGQDKFTLSLPLYDGSKKTGYLGIYAGEKDSFQEEECRILKELAGNLSQRMAVLDKISS